MKAIPRPATTPDRDRTAITLAPHDDRSTDGDRPIATSSALENV
jgi:hypothetical protein